VAHALAFHAVSAQRAAAPDACGGACEAAAETDWDFEDIRFLKSLRKTTPPLLVDQSPTNDRITDSSIAPMVTD